MKLCKLSNCHVGSVRDDRIFDLTEAGLNHPMEDIISEKVSLAEVAALEAKAPEVSKPEASFDMPCSPSKILCVGLNYRSHAIETKGTPPKEPVLFSKFNDAACADGKEVVLPPWQRCYDYEAELVIIISKECWHVETEEAENYIFGYTCGNDLSARDCQFISAQWLIGKTFPDFAPFGPYIITKDEFLPQDSHYIRCYRNDEMVQDGNTNDMIFNCREIVAYASRFCRLRPGDVIFTGTPAGVILGKPKGTRNWLKPGETVRVEIEGIGTLTNKLV